MARPLFAMYDNRGRLSLLLMLAMASAVVSDIRRVEARPPWHGPVVPPSAAIVGVVMTGSGCASTTPSITISADKKSIMLPLPKYSVSVPAASPLDKEKSCMITINLRYPAGWAYKASSWSYKGRVQLDKMLVAHHSAKFYYQGGSPAWYLDHVFNGGRSGFRSHPYSFTESCARGGWSPCWQVRGLNILTRLWIDNRRNPRGRGIITSDGGNSVYRLDLIWLRCR